MLLHGNRQLTGFDAVVEVANPQVWTHGGLGGSKMWLNYFDRSGDSWWTLREENSAIADGKGIRRNLHWLILSMACHIGSVAILSPS